MRIFIPLAAALLLALAPGAHATSPVDKASCTFKGKKLYGKIQVVTSFPDVKVQVVTSFPDQCGKWQVVTSFPDTKIQYVTSCPDVKIQYVESFPGVP